MTLISSKNVCPFIEKEKLNLSRVVQAKIERPVKRAKKIKTEAKRRRLPLER
jgi:hypothetical protein